MIAGRDAVHIDAIVADLARQRPRKSDHAGLGGGHVGEIRAAGHAESAAHVDDLAALLLEHMRNGEPRAQEHAAQMHLDHVIPGLHRHIGEFGGIKHSGIVDENVDGAETF